MFDETTKTLDPQVNRGSLWLWGSCFLLVINSAYLAAAEGLNLFYLSNLLLHPLLGILLLVPFSLWWWRRRSRRILGGLFIFASSAAGLLVIVLGNRPALRPLVWAHVILAIAGIASLLMTVPTPARGGLWRCSVIFTVLAILVPALIRLPWFHESDPQSFTNARAPLSLAEMAQDGAEGPFYPSAASTCGGQPLSAELFTHPESCARCHADIVAEWSSSAHHHSGLDNPWYRSAYGEMVNARGGAAGRWCAGCHSPDLLLSEQLDRPIEEIMATPAAHTGVSCIVCHGISKVKSTMGQGHFELCVPELHRWATSSNPLLSTLHDLLIRVDPEPHRRAYAGPALDPEYSAKFCSACHTGFMDEPINSHFAYTVFDDYALWQVSNRSGESVTRSIASAETRTCIDCHMPPGDRGDKVRSHRFAAANTALPTLYSDAQQLQAVTEFLQEDQVSVDIFALVRSQDETSDDPNSHGGERLYAPLNRSATGLRRGESVRLDVVVSNRGTGHSFPGGKIDLPDAWLEVKADDENGRTIYWSGKAEEGTPVAAGAHRYVVRMADDDGNQINQHNVWELRTVPWQRLLEAGDADVGHFRLEVPDHIQGPITVTARFNYRKFFPEFTRWALSSTGTGAMHVPIVVMAEDTITLPILEGEGELPKTERRESDGTADAMRWRDYGHALVIQGQNQAAYRAFRRSLELAPQDITAYIGLAWAQRLEGELDQARSTLEDALELAPDDPRAHYCLGLVERRAGNPERALEAFRKVTEGYPQDIDAQRFLASTLFGSGNFEEAVDHYQKVLEVDPRHDLTHLGLMRSFTALRDERGEYHKQIFQRFEITQSFLDAIKRYFDRYPEEFPEPDRGHEHRSIPLEFDESENQR